MKKYLFLSFIIALLLGCSLFSTDPEVGFGRLRIVATDAPPPLGVEHIFLTITEVNIHRAESGWINLATLDSTFDFLELINGTTAILADTLLPAGHYTQLRLEVADTNQIVIDGQTYLLVVPSGTETGVKLNLDATLEKDEELEILVDFDAAKAISWTPDVYLLHPTFRALFTALTGSVSGTVSNTSGAPIANAVIQASTLTDTVTTLSGSTGEYKLTLSAGVYSLSASAAGYSSADTTYTAVVLNAGDVLTGYDFILK